MSNPIFFIDGQTEKKIVQQLCPGKPVRITGLNGKDVTLTAIAKKIAPLIKLLGGKHYPIVILIDKEQRKISFDDVVEQLKDALLDEELCDEDLRIGVADRMLENWILADWTTLTGKKKSSKNMEGTNGAAEIKKAKGSYNKTTDGVDFFIAAKQKTVYESSPSFRHFVDQLIGIDCHYLNFEK